MSKKSEVEEAAELLQCRGMDYGMAFANLLECNREFIDKLIEILR